MTAVDFGGTARFRIERPIGSGGMGVVYEATDTSRGTRVALKTLRNLDASSIIRFKAEFRALADLHHENLVRFGELGVEESQYFFTMELLHGVDFLSYVRPGIASESIADGTTKRLHATETLAGAQSPRGSIGPEMRPGKLDEARLRDALAQITRGLGALHAAGKVHRDVKPMNVIVESNEGHAPRVVIVDFGLVTDANASSGVGEGVIGTVAYMAPEQATGEAVGAAADWYAVGVMLYEALTGEVPFFGSAYEVLTTKRTAKPPRPRDAAPDTPDDLDALCTALLQPDPKNRPSHEDVARRLGLAPTPRTSLMPAGENAPPFVGRHRELEQLQRAYEQARARASTTVYIHGESGLGKTALARHFVGDVQKNDPRVVVLKGRCYERESVPYKAVDGVIDALGQWLLRAPRAELLAVLPHDAARLGRAFPVLARLQTLAAATGEPQSAASSALDPLERRTRVFFAMRDLIHAIAREHVVVMLIDDLQWADADSLLLLREVMRPPPTSILVIATVRTVQETTRHAKVGEPPASLPQSRLNVGSSTMPGDVRVIQLEPLGNAESRELAEVLIERAQTSGRVTDSTADAIVREAAGHPLFIDELVRHAHVASRARSARSIRLEDALWGRIQVAEDAERRLLDVLAVARGPLSYEAAAAACGLGGEAELDEIVGKLRFERLVRTTRMRDRACVEAYHDRIRQALLGHLQNEAEVHAHIARALEACGDTDLEALAEHHRGAGDLVKASAYALRAAAIATEQLAFERAARLYEWALEMRPESATRETLLDLATALASAGRGSAAAEAYVRAAKLTENTDSALDLRRRAAHQLLTTGYLREGMAVMDDVMQALDVKVAPSPGRALASLAIHQVRLRMRGLRFKRRAATPRELARVDACFTASAGLAFVDTLRGAELQARGLLFALRAGDPARVARALTNEAAYVAIAGDSARPRWSALLDAARTLAAEIGDASVVAHVLAGEGVALSLSGYWLASRARCEEARRLLREHSPTSTWEIDAATLYSLRSLLQLGQLHALRAELPERIADAEARGDRFAARSLRGGELNLLWLALGDVDGARSEVGMANDEAEASSPVQLPQLQELLARARIDLYTGDGAQAHRRITESWAGIERSRLLRIQHQRVILFGIRARAALASARLGRQSRPLLDEAAHFGNELARCGASWALAEAAMLRGCLAQALGDAQRAAVSFEQAARDYTSCDMTMHAAVARLRWGKLASGEDGRIAVNESRGWMQAQGVADFEAFAAVLAP